MIDVPGCDALSSPDGVLYLTPKSAVPESKPRSLLFGGSAAAPAEVPKAWPRMLAKSAVFTITASNPMGVEKSASENAQANMRLQKDIKNLFERPAPPRAWWHSFGFNVQEGWREDGFAIAYGVEERLFGLKDVLRLASKYNQAAVYMYRVVDGELVREVVWRHKSKQELYGAAPEKLAVLKQPPESKLAASRWVNLVIEDDV